MNNKKLYYGIKFFKYDIIYTGCSIEYADSP